jgi:hypothetical protein
MSKLVSEIKVGKTNRQRIKPPSLFCEMVQITDTIQPSYDKLQTEYRIEARLGSSYWIGDTEALEYAIEHVKESLIQAIFGEFREPLMMIERYIMLGKYDEARRAVQDLQTQMFEVDNDD